MSTEFIIYGIFSTVISAMLIIISIFMNESPEYTTHYYKYKIKYYVDLDKYYSMLKKQKRLILKKKIELLYLKTLLKIKKGI